MARGFDIDDRLLVKVLGASATRWLRSVDARMLCAALRAHPAEIWPERVASRLGDVDWETETLWSDTGVDPVVVRS